MAQNVPQTQLENAKIRMANWDDEKNEGLLSFPLCLISF